MITNKSNKIMMADCDDCNERFAVKTYTISKPKGIQKDVFDCPYCETQYLIGYTNEAIRANMKRVRKLQGYIQREPNKTRRKELYAEYLELKEDMKARSEQLRVLMDG